MSTPRPESRISELETQMALHSARIRELSDDTAESLRDIKQDIKLLDSDMKASFRQIDDYFGRIEQTMATKDDLKPLATKSDINTLETRLDKIEATQEQILKLLQQR